MMFLAYAYGSPNWTLFGLSGLSCFTPRLATQHNMEGDMTYPDAAQFLPLRYDDPEWVPPKCLVLWGVQTNAGCESHYYDDHYD